MVPVYITKLIEAHRSDKKRIEYAGSLPQIVVSRAASAMGKLYEIVRNTIDYEEEHLIRKKAIKRIILRMGVLRRNNDDNIAADFIKEMIWAKYLSDNPVPEASIEVVKNSLNKYKTLVDFYIKQYGTKPDKPVAEFLYSMLSVELERILVTQNEFDALVNAQYQFMLPLGLLSQQSGLKPNDVPVQTYIAVHRALLKSDNDIIGYYLFHNAFNLWGNPPADYFPFVAKNLDKVVKQINDHLSVTISPRINQEVIRQAIPFKILNNIIKRNLGEAEKITDDEKEMMEQVETVSKAEYRKIRGKLRNTMVRSVIYLFITKVGLALIIELPYEHFVLGHISYLNLAINVVIPPLFMLLIASTFGIPEIKNTEKLKQMINNILTPVKNDEQKEVAKSYFSKPTGMQSLVFKLLNFLSFAMVFGIILVALLVLKFNVVAMLIFIIFLSAICFFAVKLRKTASEIVVINQSRSIFSPIIDIAAVPILWLGKNLSEGASQFNFVIIIFDALLEAPYKSIIKVLEDWTNYLRERRDEIV